MPLPVDEDIALTAIIFAIIIVSLGFIAWHVAQMVVG